MERNDKRNNGMEDSNVDQPENNDTIGTIDQPSDQPDQPSDQPETVDQPEIEEVPDLSGNALMRLQGLPAIVRGDFARLQRQRGEMRDTVYSDMARTYTKDHARDFTAWLIDLYNQAVLVESIRDNAHGHQALLGIASLATQWAKTVPDSFSKEARMKMLEEFLAGEKPTPIKAAWSANADWKSIAIMALDLMDAVLSHPQTPVALREMRDKNNLPVRGVFASEREKLRVALMKKPSTK